MPSPRQIRIAFVIASPAGEGAAEVRVLAGALDPARYRIDAICCGDSSAPCQVDAELDAAGVTIDLTPGRLAYHERVDYLAGRLPAYDIVVAGPAVGEVSAALARLHLRPSLIEQGAPIGAADWEARFAAASADRPAPATPTKLFRSFLQGGFECSTHRRAHDRQRLDMIAASHHDIHAGYDYRTLADHGLLTVRDGLRWHRIEREPGRYDWSSLDAQLTAARTTGIEVIWDLLHYGWPDDVDVWSPDFPARFAAFAAAAARHIGPAGPGERRFYAPVNEISFLAWAGGDAGYLNPFAQRRSLELKVALVRAAIAAMEAIRAVDPAVRFVHADPVINVVADPARPGDSSTAEGHRRAQFEAWDMIAGIAWPQLGGRSGLLDIVGVNFYHNNQWIHGGGTLAYDDALGRPFRDILADTYARYGRPIFVAETGIEGDARAGWLRMIAREVTAAMEMGVPVEGICLYPILDHPGWDDDRYCPNGLLACSAESDKRRADPALAAALADVSAAIPASRPFAAAPPPRRFRPTPTG